ncbi:uncharacterized protein METZ01_LOCUS367950, partial [marine metagenome]
ADHIFCVAGDFSTAGQKNSSRDSSKKRL